MNVPMLWYALYIASVHLFPPLSLYITIVQPAVARLLDDPMRSRNSAKLALCTPNASLTVHIDEEDHPVKQCETWKSEYVRIWQNSRCLWWLVQGFLGSMLNPLPWFHKMIEMKSRTATNPCRDKPFQSPIRILIQRELLIPHDSHDSTHVRVISRHWRTFKGQWCQ